MFCSGRKITKVLVCIALAIIFLLETDIFAGALDKPKEMRGIWVSTIYSLDYPDKPTTDPQLLKKQADLISACFCMCFEIICCLEVSLLGMRLHL